MDLSDDAEKKSAVTRPGIDPGTFRLVAQRLNHYATPGPKPKSVRNLLWRRLWTGRKRDYKVNENVENTCLGCLTINAISQTLKVTTSFVSNLRHMVNRTIFYYMVLPDNYRLLRPVLFVYRTNSPLTDCPHTRPNSAE